MLSRVLTAEWPAGRSRVPAASERPLQEGPRSGRSEAWAPRESWGEVWKGSPG